MESRGIMLVGLWTFAIVSLLGGIYGRLDGFIVVMLFIVAVVVSLGAIAMPKAKAQYWCLAPTDGPETDLPADLTAGATRGVEEKPALWAASSSLSSSARHRAQLRLVGAR